jgi:hypothetical protein
MKARLASLTLLALSLAAVPAVADIYNNGPINGNTDAWTINSGFAVSDTFTTPGGFGFITGLQFGAWVFPGDTITSVEVTITSQEFGGISFFDGIVNLSQGGCVSNSFGFDVCTETGSFDAGALAAGTYWLNLQNASVPSGDPVYWDENSGPSAASQSSVGTIPSESFTVLGGATTSTTTTGGTTPEPSSIMLFGSGILGLAGVLKQKMNF